jgi:hypothetical protein
VYELAELFSVAQQARNVVSEFTGPILASNMDDSNEVVVAWDLKFQPDEDAEEELAPPLDFDFDPSTGKTEYVDPALITDETVKKCRVLAAVHCIEYGTILVSPNQKTPAMLLVINFTFHPFESRVKRAFVELALARGSIMVLQPESVDDSETTETIRKKLTGEMKIGYPPAGVQGGVAAERETETTKSSALRIRGSGAHTHRATWTLKENPEDKKGIHLNFTGIVVAAVQGETEVDFEIRAKLGHSLSTDWGIRHIITRRTIKIDGKKLLGVRPTTLDIHESYFCGSSDPGRDGNSS